MLKPAGLKQGAERKCKPCSTTVGGQAPYAHKEASLLALNAQAVPYCLHASIMFVPGGVLPATTGGYRLANGEAHQSCG